MANIAIDIDSTLYDFETPAREAMFRLYKETNDSPYKEGAYHPWTEWRSPADVLGLERWLRVIDLVHDANVIETMRPFDGAVETCTALRDEGHTLLYISNRSTESSEATENWLGSWGFTDDTTQVLCTGEDKARYMSDCQYIIDDRLKTVVEFVYDHTWESAVRRRADQIRNIGPDPDSPFYKESFKAQDRALAAYYAENDDLRKHHLGQAREIANKAAEVYYQENRRRAFVKGYPYNQAGTDIPGLYVALSWAGLNDYLVSKGVLTKPATIPLGVLNGVH